jgi:ADP-ribosyl-[dinitrogen reductase] hydrolase
MTSQPNRQRAIGALVGSVVGDALGAPFEFGPAHVFSRRFPTPALGVHTEMCGGGSCGWEPAEWTDDTQMALCVAASLLAQGDLDLADVWRRFRAWADADPVDIGITTSQVLRSGLTWGQAATAYFRRDGRATGNGGLMRTTPAALRFAREGTDATMDVGRLLTLLTHGDPAAGEGSAIFHELIRIALDGHDPLTAIDHTLAKVPEQYRDGWATVLAPTWTPDQATLPNGVSWTTLGTAVWALRTTDTFADAVRAAVDEGGDTDTVACITGALAGARYGIQAIPSRWTTYLHGRVPGNEPAATNLDELEQLALALIGEAPGPPRGATCGEGLKGPLEVLPGLWVGNLDALEHVPQPHAVLSLCRTADVSRYPQRRSIFLQDHERDAHANPGIDAVLVDVVDEIVAFRQQGVDVFVHCYGGASRTGLILRAYLRRTEGMSPADATRKAQQLWPSTALWNTYFDEALERLPA